MRFKVGDILRNTITNEEAPVARIADTDPDNIGYVVCLNPDSRWQLPARESLWPERQVKAAKKQTPDPVL
jgi:hypothetical protein